MSARALGKRLVQARRRAGLSCAQVATALGLSPGRLRLLEAGHGFTLALLQQLAAFYGLTVGTLLSGVPPHPSDSL